MGKIISVTEPCTESRRCERNWCVEGRVRSEGRGRGRTRWEMKLERYKDDGGVRGLAGHVKDFQTF